MTTLIQTNNKHSYLFRLKNERVCDLYKQGLTAHDIGNIVGLSETRVYSIAREYGIRKRGKPMK